MTPDQLPGREVSKTYIRKQDATRWRENTKQAFGSGSYVDPAKGRVLFETISARWIATRTVKPSTLRSYNDLVNSRIDKQFGKTYVNKITETMIEDWVIALNSELSPSRVRKLILCTRQIFRIAVREKMIKENPVTSEIKPPQARQLEVAALELFEAQDLVDAIPEHYKLPTLFLCGTGLRMSEFIAVQKRHLTLTPGKESVFVQDAIVELSDGRFVEGSPKTWHRRHVGIPAHIVPALKRHIKDLKPGDRL
ncbi:MAG: hypothetical protein WCP28_05045 [Actinomycetes bacterium]